MKKLSNLCYGLAIINIMLSGCAVENSIKGAVLMMGIASAFMLGAKALEGLSR